MIEVTFYAIMLIINYVLMHISEANFTVLKTTLQKISNNFCATYYNLFETDLINNFKFMLLHCLTRTQKYVEVYKSFYLDFFDSPFNFPQGNNLFH